MRSLLWLIALAAFVLPSFGVSIAAGHAMAPPQQAASVECPDHAPPPQDCPAEGTAKHAAGQCCPLMAGVVALLSPTVTASVSAVRHALVSATTHDLTGRLFTQDPPPPRL